MWEREEGEEWSKLIERREKERESACVFVYTIEAVSSVTLGDGTGESDPSTKKRSAKVHRNLWIREPLLCNC